MKTRWLLALAFVSGGCALVYQVVWTRELRLVFGASTPASAAVVAIFVAGLGLGAWKIGQRAERSRRPLLLYAGLELGVAVSVVVSLFALVLATRVYERLGGSVVLGPAGAAVVRLMLSVLVLGPATVLMGGTLPALARAAMRYDEDPGRRSVALLYGVNTLGAVTGCCAATFWLIEKTGEIGSILLTVAVNALVALAAGALWLWVPSLGVEVEDGDESSDARPLVQAAPRFFVLGASATVGFAFFLMELVFYRMLVPLTGGTVYTFGLVLATALFGIGTGGAAYAALFARREVTLAGFATTCLLEAAGLAVPYALGDRIALLAVGLRPLGALGFGGHVAAWTVVTAIVVLPASLAAGVQFPMLVALLGRGRPGVARDVGLAYAWNTVGAVGGAIAGGFGLMAALTAPGCWRVAADLLVATGIAAAGLSIRKGPRRRRGWSAPLWHAAIAAGTLVLLRAMGPTAVWRHQPIGAGRVPVSKIQARDGIDSYVRDVRRGVIWEADGVESTVALESASGHAFIVNAKSDGHCREDAGTQVMGGLLGALLQGQPRSAMVIGLGSGSSAGWLARVPTMEHVDVAELEPAMLEVARRCAPVNEDVLDNPKVRVMRGDGRELLSVSRSTYDVIFSEPSNPYRAGVASLYTVDYYARALAHLSDTGVFVQWLQAYEIDTPTMKTLMATIGTVFPSVEIWQLREPDLALVASRAPMVNDVSALRARIATEPFDRALRVAWGVEDLEGVLAHFVAGPYFVATLAADGKIPRNTDERPIVEFAFARTVNRGDGASDVPDARTLHMFAHWRGESDKPELGGGGETIDWSRVDLERAYIPCVDEHKPEMPPSEASDDVKERIQFEDHWQDREAEEALAAWDAHPREHPTRTELLDLASAAVAAKDDRAPAFIERIAATRPVEAMVLKAQMAEHEGRHDDALALLVPALVAYRTDAWLSPGVMFRAFYVAREVARDRGPAAQQLLDTLKEPLVLESYREERLETAIDIARRIDSQRGCREALAPVEPNMFWRKAVLEYRRDCYRVTGDPRGALAQQELDTYDSEQSQKFEW